MEGAGRVEVPAEPLVRPATADRQQVGARPRLGVVAAERHHRQAQHVLPIGVGLHAPGRPAIAPHPLGKPAVGADGRSRRALVRDAVLRRHFGPLLQYVGAKALRAVMAERIAGDAVLDILPVDEPTRLACIVHGDGPSQSLLGRWRR